MGFGVLSLEGPLGGNRNSTPPSLRWVQSLVLSNHKNYRYKTIGYDKNLVDRAGIGLCGAFSKVERYRALPTPGSGRPDGARR